MKAEYLFQAIVVTGIKQLSTVPLGNLPKASSVGAKTGVAGAGIFGKGGAYPRFFKKFEKAG